MTDDLWELLSAWQAGDRGAGDRLVDLAFPRVARFFRNKVAQVPDDDDLAQKTFLALASIRPRSTEGSFWSLLYGIMRNVLREYIREKYKRTKEEADFETLCVRELDARSLSSVAVRTRELQAFVEGLRQIPLSDQILLELRFFDGMTAREIGEVLGMARGSVHRAVDGGIDRLRKAVAEELSAGSDGQEPPSARALHTWAEDIRSQIG